MWSLLPFFIKERIEAPYRYDVRRKIIRILQQKSGKILDVLDIGAGDCFARKFFENLNYTALDIAPGKGIDVVGDAENLPFQKDSFDVIVCFEVLEYLPKPEKALKEIFKSLRRDGILLLSSPLMVSFHNDLYRFTPPALKKLVRSAGFKNIKISPVGGYYRMLAYQLSRLSYKIKKTKSKPLLPVYYLIKIPVGLVMQVLVPFLLFYLDGLDKKKTETCGYVVTAVK